MCYGLLSEYFRESLPHSCTENFVCVIKMKKKKKKAGKRITSPNSYVVDWRNEEELLYN